MKIPDPFGTSVAVGDTTEMGLQAMPDTKYGRGKLASELGAQFDKVLEKWQADVDETRIRDNANELQRFLIEQKSNPETGWINFKGENALYRPDGVSLEEETSQAFKRRYQELRSRCANERQKRALDEAYGGMDVQRQQGVAAWMVQQQGVYQESVDKRDLETAYQIGTDYTDPVNLESGLSVARETAARIAKRAGVDYDPSVGPGLIHASNIDQMIDDLDVESAKAYYKQYKHEMSAKQCTEIDKALDIADRKMRERDAADEIIAKYGNDPASALRASKALPDDIKDGARTRVRQHISDVQSIQAATAKSLRKQAASFVAQDKDLPPSLEQQLLEYDPEYLRRLNTSRAKSTGKGVTQSNEAALAELETMERFDPQSFAEVDLNEFAPFLSKGDFNKLKSRQAKLGDASFSRFKTVLNSRMDADKYFKKPARRREVLNAAEAVFTELRAQKPNGYIDENTLNQVAGQLLSEETGWFADRGYVAVRDREKEVSAIEAIAGANFETDASLSELQSLLKAKGVYGNATPEQLKAAKQLVDGYGYPPSVWKQATDMAVAAAKKRQANGENVRVTNRVIQRCADHILFSKKD